jgi:hypothetical protein
MLEDLQIRNYAPTTVAADIRSVAEFAKHFGKSPDLLGSEQIREYQMYLIQRERRPRFHLTYRLFALSDFSTPTRCIAQSAWIASRCPGMRRNCVVRLVGPQAGIGHEQDIVVKLF